MSVLCHNTGPKGNKQTLLLDSRVVAGEDGVH